MSRTPWSAIEVGQSSAGDDGVPVYEITDGFARIAEYLTERDAKHIVRCVNAHDELRAALERAQSCIRGLLARTPVRDVSETLAEIESALSRATGAAK